MVDNHGVFNILKCYHISVQIANFENLFDIYFS